MSDNDSDVSETQEWALVEDQETAQDSEGSNDFVCVEDTKCASYHHKTALQEQGMDDADRSDDDDGHVGPPQVAEGVENLSPIADSSSVSDTVTMSAAVAQDEAESATSSCSLEELSVPREDALSQSSSSLEELSLPVDHLENLATGGGQSLVNLSLLDRISKADLNGSREEQVDSGQWQPLDPERSLLSSMRMRRPSGSDTDHSDFVRLDASQPEDMAGDLMHLSTASSLTASSSVSSTFRFIHRSDMVLGEEPARRGYYRDNDEDSVPSDIDDRCESDISGIAGDDTDLSHLTYSLGDVPIAAGARCYKHRPNNSLNATLTTFSLVALFFALGIGLGDFIGFHRQAGLRLQQVGKLRSLQDDYLLCLQQQEESGEILEQQQKDNEVIQAVTEEWKQQYEELIVERVALESKIEELQNRMKIDAETGRELLHEMEGNTLSKLIDRLEDQSVVSNHTNTALVSSESGGTVDTGEDTALTPQKEFPSEDMVTGLLEEVDTLNKEKNKLEFEMKAMQYDVLHEKKQLQELQYQLQQKLDTNLTAELQLLKEEKDELLFKMDLMKYDVLNEKQTLDQLQTIATEKLEMFHQLAVENGDLKKEVAKLRYSEHPGNSVGTPTEDETKEDLSLVISRLEQEVEDVQRKLVTVTENLHRETKTATMWQERFVEKSYQFDEILNKSPDIVTCLSFIFPAVTLRDVSNLSSGALRNLSNFLTNQMGVIQKLADDTDFLKAVSGKWAMLRTMLGSPLAEEVHDQTKAAYEEIRAIVVSKFESLGGVMFEPRYTDSANGAISENGGKEEINSYHIHLHRMVNKTKETVTKLTKKINQTWEKVKDMSGHVTNKVVNDVVPLMKAEVGKLKGKVQHGWETVKNKVESGLFRKKGKKKAGKNRGDTGDATSDTKHRMSETDRRQYHGDPYSNEAENGFDDIFTQQTSHRFEHKPEHKQKTSDSHMEKGPQTKFWDNVGFNPDDVLHDGFFEGNERKWRKHQKVLKKLHGRINKLNEDVLYDMDDDDVEDLYEDLEDFQEDLEDEVQPMGLKTWLTCQLRWWKGRFQRKHRSEDLIKGCGRQLMHWQMKAICEVKGHRLLVSMPACLQYFPDRSVIRTVANDASSFNAKKKHQHSRESTTKNCGKNCSGKKKWNKGDEFTCQNTAKMEKEAKNFVDNDEVLYGNKKFGPIMDEAGNFSPTNDHVANDTSKDDNADWWFQREQHRENQHVSGDWYWKSQPGNRNHHSEVPSLRKESWISGSKEADSSWYFNHAEAHEFYRHDTHWMFGRAREREFHREKPWYVGRAEKRNDRHRKKYGDD